MTPSRVSDTDLRKQRLPGTVCVCVWLKVLISHELKKKKKPTHTSGGSIMTAHVWKLTRTERGHVVGAGEVQCGPRDVHHVVIIVVTGGVKAIEAPVAVARVLPHSEPCGEQRNAVNSSRSSSPPSGPPSPDGETVGSTSVGPKRRHSERGNVDV